MNEKFFRYLLKFISRARHQLAEKIRQLSRGVGIKKEWTKILETQKSIEIKHEGNHTAYILLEPEHQSLYPVVFHQIVKLPESKYLKFDLYQIPSMEIESEKIFQNTEKSPSKKKIKLRKKKKRSVTYSRIEELLYTGKNIFLIPDPSEESILFEANEETQDVPKQDITNLPEDLLQHIFWYFSLKERCNILSKVCKRWYYISKNPVFWKELEFTGDKVPTQTILKLLDSCPLLVSLKLTSVPGASIILQEICRNKIEMRELAVRYCVMERIDCVFVLLQLTTSLPNLEVIDLEGTEFQSRRFFIELCLLKNLKSLNLGANKFLHPKDLMTISLNCRGLETLKILNIPWNAEGYEKLKDENFSFIINNLHNSLINLEHDMLQLRNLAYLAILLCNNLKKLCLTNCLFLTGEMFRRFGQLKQLKELTLTRAIHLTSEDFECVFNGGNLNDIEHLDITGCWRMDKSGLKALTKGLPSLKILSLENCKLIKGEDIKQLSYCKNLSSLNIAHTGIISRDLLSIGKIAKNLRSLTVDKNMYEAKPTIDVTNVVPGLIVQFTT